MERCWRLAGSSDWVNRPNVFIKIPGTVAGVPAIEQMLYEGIPINITLLFSLPRYEAVALAYLRALERRVADGKPVQSVASVASFFLSRIDLLFGASWTSPARTNVALFIHRAMRLERSHAMLRSQPLRDGIHE
jgi:transaldolase